MRIPGMDTDTSRRRFLAYFDGLCEPKNPGGVAAYGFAVYREPEVVGVYDAALYEESGVLAAGKKATNNLAEYGACGRAMGWLVDNLPEARGESVVIRGDSQLVIRQLSGEWSVGSPAIRPLYERAAELRRSLAAGDARPELEWVPREENEAADALSVAAYVEHQEAARRERAEGIRIEWVADGYYRAFGSSGSYEIRKGLDGNRSTCSCTDFDMLNRGRIYVRCKHLLAFEERMGVA